MNVVARTLDTGEVRAMGCGSEGLGVQAVEVGTSW